MDDTLLPLLPSLLALVEEGSVGKSARRIGISQPRMSARLATLRTILGDPLLVAASGRRGSIATDRANHLAEVARQMLARLDEVVAGAAFDPATAERTFVVMANDNAATIAGLPLIGAMRDVAGPGVRIAVRQFDQTKLAGLENGHFDLAIGSPSQFERMPTLIARTILRDRFVCALRSGETRIDSLAAYCARDHVLVSGDGGGFDGPVDRALRELGQRRRIAVSVQSYLLAIEAVATSDMIATLPLRLLAGRERGLAIFEPPISLPPFVLAAVWHPRKDGDPAHRWLRDQLDVAVQTTT